MGITKEIWNQEAADKEIEVFIYEDTEVSVRTSKDLTEKYQIRKKVRQSYVHSCLICILRTLTEN